MVASTSTTVPSAQDDDISLLRAILIGRKSQEVKNYTVQYEDQVKLVEALGTAMKAPENRATLDVLAMKERRLDAALVREANAIEKLNIFLCRGKGCFSGTIGNGSCCFRSVVGGRWRYYYYYSAFDFTRRFQQENYEAEAPGTRRWLESSRK